MAQPKRSLEELEALEYRELREAVKEDRGTQLWFSKEHVNLKVSRDELLRVVQAAYGETPHLSWGYARLKVAARDADVNLKPTAEELVSRLREGLDVWEENNRLTTEISSLKQQLRAAELKIKELEALTEELRAAERKIKELEAFQQRMHGIGVSSEEDESSSDAAQMTHEEAKAWMAESDTHMLFIKNFSDTEDRYFIEGGLEALKELELTEYPDDEFAKFEFYKPYDFPFILKGTVSEDDKGTWEVSQPPTVPR